MGVDTKWKDVAGHRDITSAEELQRLIRMAGSCAGRMVDVQPPLLVDDPSGWFDFWAAELLVLTRDTLVRALIKSFGTSDDERDEVRAAVFAVWGLFCGGAESISRTSFVADDGMADAILAALAGNQHASGAAPVLSEPAPQGHWSCSRCTLHNEDSVDACVACDAPKPRETASATGPESNRDLGILHDQAAPICIACGAEQKASRIRSDGQRTSCQRCRRNPPVGAAVWRCDCGAALCIRCATVSGGMRRRAVPNEVQRALLAEASLAMEMSHQQDNQVQAGPYTAADHSSRASAPVELVECPNCRRYRAPAGVEVGRRQRWCLCSPDALEEGLVLGPRAASSHSAATLLPAELSAAASAEPAECANCQRPQAPIGWVGINSRRWCQCNGDIGEGTRQYMRTRQLLRTVALQRPAAVSWVA